MSHATRRLSAVLLVLTLLPLLWVLASPGAPATASSPGASRTPPSPAPRVVGTDRCRSIDPNLVRGACLDYAVDGQHGLTWIGSYRAPSGRTFFCIDYLYDSRLPAHARVTSTRRLVNQLGRPVGPSEVAALNAVVSRWAAHGSTGSDARDAAIALIVREVMSDGVRPGGTVVYPPGLRVGTPVRAPRGGLPASVLGLARQMWSLASAARGPYSVELTPRHAGRLRLGASRAYHVAVRSVSGRLVGGVPVALRCHGPIRCPHQVVSRERPVTVSVRPRDVGRFSITARASGPASGGRLYVAHGWHTHGGSTALDAGTQRGWIAQRNTARASVAASAVIVRARPQVTTTTSEQVVLPGATLRDRVTVTGLPRGYDHPVTARLFGPYDHVPGAADCAAAELAGQVRVRVSRNGTITTPGVVVGSVGRYVWQETLPGDRSTLPVTTPCGVASETSLVHQLTPVVSTVVSHQSVVVGHPLHDTVRVSGIADQPVVVRWLLHGPVAPRGGACSALDWTTAPLRATGTLSAPGDGVYVTPDTVVAAGGCYTYSEQIAATATTTAASSVPGVVAETALVTRRQPFLHTVVSARRLDVGGAVRDTVRVGGLAATDRVDLHWRLLGPVAPGRAGCGGLSWGRAPVAARGSRPVRGSGTVTTAAVRLRAPGCYTYAEWLTATPTTEAASSPAGLGPETALAVRPPLPTPPVVPSGPSGTRTDPRFYRAPARLDRAGVGGRLRVPSLHVDAPVDAVGLDRSTLAIPGDTAHVGWLTRSAAPGDVMGASVLAGHVSDRHDRPGVFWRLRQVAVGAQITWVDDAGAEHRFRVTHLARYPRAHRLPAAVFDTEGPHVLELVTCTSRRDLGGGHFHYADNLVVTAVAVS